MSPRDEPEPVRDRLISLRAGQWALIVAIFATLGALIMSSLLSVAAHDAELDGLFNQEGDGTAMNFVQRESFGVVLELDAWARGESTAREVQISRALLGQRLQVVTVSGDATYSLTGLDYRGSLDDLDTAIRSLVDDPIDERSGQRVAMNDAVNEFTSSTRELSAIYQTLTRDRATAAINSRALFEQLQAVIAIIAVALGIVLALWLAVGLRRAYREASEGLHAQTQGLVRASRRLAFHHELQRHARSWSEALKAGQPTPTIIAAAEADLRQLLPFVEFDLIAGGDQPSKFVTLPLAGSDPLDVGEREGDVEVALALSRANEAIELAEGRDALERTLASERQRDGLTGLPNRELLQESVDDALARARGGVSGAVVALVLFDIERFADFNTSFGHHEGDRLLIDVAARLQSAAPEKCAVLRLSADEFAVVGAFASDGVARRHLLGLANELSFSFTVDTATTAIGVSSGAVITRSLDVTPDALIKRAAAALAARSRVGPREPVRYFRWDHDEHLMEVLHEESALRSAIRSGEFVMHYQPIVALASGQLAASEALVRWNRPGVGLVGPNDFLPGIARAGLAVELGWQIIDLALSTWGSQRAAAGGVLDEIYVSINLDARQLDVPTVVDFITNALTRHRVPPRNLVLEVTEHVFVGGEFAILQLERLREHGIRIALDDFGTGYSSLSQASSLPLDIIKIDRSFVPDPQLDDQQRGLLGDIVSMASRLGLLVVTEGVETREVADDLDKLGVGFGQGWHWAPAMPIDDFVEWARAHRAAKAVSGD